MSLKRVRFPLDKQKEEAVRAAIVEFFRGTGFLQEELRFETHFDLRLGHTAFRVDGRPTKAIKGYSDLLILRQGIPFILVETKSPDHALSDADDGQALSYARLLLSMPPFTILTNGVETRFFETVSAKRISISTDSQWCMNGERQAPLSEDERRFASRVLLRSRIDVLRRFSSSQLASGLSELKGPASEGYRYSAGLYILRKPVLTAFQDFLSSSKTVFGIVGESGTGKSNEMCRLAEWVDQDKSFVGFFYRAIRTAGGLFDALRVDFEWEQLQDAPLAQVVDYLTGMARNHKVRIVLFVDGLDETTTDRGQARADLCDLVPRLDPDLLRIVVSCKSLDWSDFVRDRSESLNSFGRRVAPEPAGNSMPGYFLFDFDDKELKRAWRKYRQEYKVKGELPGELGAEYANPFHLRLLAEAFAGCTLPTGADFHPPVVYDHFLKRKFAELNVDERAEAQAAAVQIATYMIETDRLRVSMSRVAQDLPSVSAHISGLLRLGILRGSLQGDGHLAFAYSKLALFLHSVVAREWDQITPNNVEGDVRSALQTRLGQEAIRFFVAICRPTRNLFLGMLLAASPPLFLEVIWRLFPPSYQFASKRFTGASLNLLDQFGRYIVAYSRLRELCRPIKKRLLPCTRGMAGVWVTDSRHGLRSLTKEVKEEVVFLHSDQAARLLRRTPDLDIVQSIAPAGEIREDLFRFFEDRIPETASVAEFSSQLANLIRRRALDEMPCVDILGERAATILVKDFGDTADGLPAGPIYRQLGFETLEQALSTHPTEMAKLAGDLQHCYLIVEKKSAAERQRKLGQIRALLFVLTGCAINLAQTHEADSFPQHSHPERFDNEKVEFFSSVKHSYVRLVAHNFGPLAEALQTYALFRTGSRILVEITSDDAGQRYATFVCWPQGVEGPMSMKSRSWSKSAVYPMMTESGPFFRLSATVAVVERGLRTEVKGMAVNRVPFPASAGCSELVYQLLLNELKQILVSGWRDWEDARDNAWMEGPDAFVSTPAGSTEGRKVAEAGVTCPRCNETTRLHMDFEEETPMREGSIRYPKSGIYTCPGCFAPVIVDHLPQQLREIELDEI